MALELCRLGRALQQCLLPCKLCRPEFCEYGVRRNIPKLTRTDLNDFLSAGPKQGYTKDQWKIVTRKMSGCESNDHTVCRSMPFSQFFNDELRSERDQEEESYNCDEWPMALVQTEDFLQGSVRNSLRCVEEGENFSEWSPSCLPRHERADKPTRSRCKDPQFPLPPRQHPRKNRFGPNRNR